MNLINRLRGFLDLQKPTALGWDEWEDWHEQTRKMRPLAYFLMETMPEKCNDLIKTIKKPYDNTRNWMRYRLFDRYHLINTGLKPDYYEIDTRMLHGMFSLLVDFVEVQSAWVHVIFDEKSKYNDRPWWSKGWTRFKSFRDVESGIAHLKWEMTLDSENLPVSERNPGQAHMAREVWELYHWWTKIRPLRPDPGDVSGWNEYCRSKTMKELFSNNRSPEENKVSLDIINLDHDIERSYDEEDERMLIRLVKIRKNLWT